jgi:DNA-binding beta-propeller fold protein YncE
MRRPAANPMSGATRAPLILALTLLCVSALVPAGAGAAEPPRLTQFCEGGSAAGRCSIPRGIAVDPTTGDAYVADQANDRIQKFSAWGGVLKVWGWDVVVSGPGDDTLAPEDEFEVCVPANGDVCKAGVKGGGSGQLVRPQGVALDSAGNVYVAEGDFGSRRVQKFDSEGNFILMFGGGVNKTKVEALAPEAERNLCPVDPGDICQVATPGTGNGQFGAFVAGSFITTHSGPPDTVYVGDQNRIQRFDTAGHYLSDLPDPEGLMAGKTVQALAADPNAGFLYAGFGTGVEDVLKLDLTGGEEECSLEVERPSALAVDATGQVHVVSAEKFGTPSTPMQIAQFDPACKETSRFNAEKAGFQDSTGLATSSPPTCGLEEVDLFVANSSQGNSFIRIYGPPPDVDVCPPPSIAPAIEDQHALSVGTQGATVRARINPNFWPDTAYWVQYGTAECKESLAACEGKALFPGADLGAGITNAFKTTAGVFLGGLEPDTTYFFRFVAQSEGGGPAFGEGSEACALDPLCGASGSFHTYPVAPKAKVDCENQPFRTGLSAPLPDCRAYELVSPLDKNNGDIGTGAASFSLASIDGTRATYSSFASFGDPQGAPLTSQYLSSRDPEEGWLTESISPPRGSFPYYPPGAAVTSPSQFRAFSEDLCQSWVVQDSEVTYAEGAPEGTANLYRRLDLGCEAAPSTCPFPDRLPGMDCLELLTPVAPPGFSRELELAESRYYAIIQGSSVDGSRSLVRADAVLTADACKTNVEESKGLFQLYLAHAGALRLISVLPNGKAACVHSSAGTWEEELVGGVSGSSVQHATAADGSRIFWSASAIAANKDPVQKGGGAAAQPGPLYVRVNPEGPQSASGKCSTALPGEACTIQISKSKEADVRFWGADAAGTTAIYGEGPLANAELFEYDVEEEKATSIAKGVRGVAGISEDATRVYFISGEALPGAGQNSEGDEATAGKPNLYLHERGAGFEFVATLAGLDVRNAASSGEFPSPIAVRPDKRSSRISPDGMQLAFMSLAPLTGFDNTDASSGEPDAEVFLHDAGGELRCVSCNPSGARPSGREVAIGDNGQTKLWAAARLPGWESELSPTRLLSGSGDRLFFESFEALVLRDTNGKQDVYQWQRAQNRKDCEKEIGGEVFLGEEDEAEGGCLSLISSGLSSVDAEFVDASASGADVFFTTTSSLLAHDFGLLDVYDARVGGGFPPPPQPDPPCEGEACRPASSPPEDPTPASQTFKGTGNVANPPKRPRCAKGKRRVVRQGKASCVRKHKRGARQNRERAAR